MVNRYGNKRANETFLVAKAGQAFYNTAGAGNFINTLTDDSVVLADGQIGIFAASSRGSVALNTATPVAPTIAHAPSIFIAQGNENSANPSAPQKKFPLWNEPFWASAPINGNTPVNVTKRPWAVDTHSVWVIGADAGLSARALTALDNTTYQMQIAFRGLRSDIFYNPETSAGINISYATPDYTTLGTAEPLDHLIQNITWNINRNSRAVAFNRTRFAGSINAVAFAIDSTGTTGTDIAGLTAGDQIAVINTNLGVRNITLTAGMVQSLIDAQAAAVAAGQTGGWSILTIDTATAGTTSGGVADMIMIMGLDHTPAFLDTIPQVKERLDIGLTFGFDYTTVYHEEHSQAFEGHNHYRFLDILYQNTHEQRKYNLRHTEDPVVKFPSPLVDNQNYTVYNINHVDYAQIDTNTQMDSPQRTILCIPGTETTLITAVDTALNAWLASANQSAIKTL